MNSSSWHYTFLELELLENEIKYEIQKLSWPKNY